MQRGYLGLRGIAKWKVVGALQGISELRIEWVLMGKAVVDFVHETKNDAKGLRSVVVGPRTRSRQITLFFACL